MPTRVGTAWSYPMLQANVLVGVTAPLASVVHAMFIMLVILLLAPLLPYIPMASILFIKRTIELTGVEMVMVGGPAGSLPHELDKSVVAYKILRGPGGRV